MFGKLNLPPLKRKAKTCKNDVLEKIHQLLHDAAFNLSKGNEECANNIKKADELIHDIINDKSQLLDLVGMENEFFKEHQVLNKYPLSTRGIFKWLKENINKY